MKTIALGCLCFLIFILPSNPAAAQLTVVRVSGENTNVAGDGFYYSLPRTILKVDLTFEKIDRLKGPLSEYTEDYLGTSEYIGEDGTEYNLLNVELQPVFEADPEQLYYVTFPAERSKDEKIYAFRLSSAGTLLSLDTEESQVPLPAGQIEQTFIVMEGDKGFPYLPDYNRKKQIDTIHRKITIDTVSIDRFLFKTNWVDKSAEDRANEAALRITEIRQARFNLLSGYQEVNYGESMRYMDTRLRQMEQQHLELFLGKEFKTYETQTIYFIPEEPVQDVMLMDLPGSEDVRITIQTRGITGKLSKKSSQKPGSIYYRIPEMADLEITYRGEVCLRKTIPVGQFGVIASAPSYNTRMQFDPLTGSLTKIVRE